MRTIQLLVAMLALFIISCSSTEETKSTDKKESNPEQTKTLKLEKMQLTDLLDSMKQQPTLYPPFSSLNRLSNGDLSAPPTFVYLEDSLWEDITNQLDIPNTNLIGLQPGYKVISSENGILFTINLSYGAGEEKHGYLIAIDTLGKLLAKEEIEYSMQGRDGLSALKRYKLQQQGDSYQFTILNMVLNKGKKEVKDSTVLAVGPKLNLELK